MLMLIICFDVSDGDCDVYYMIMVMLCLCNALLSPTLSQFLANEGDIWDCVHFAAKNHDRLCS